jgi:hypothetical protein
MRSFLAVLVAGLALLLTPASPAKQDSTTAPFAIEVLDATGAAVAHAQIQLEPAPGSLPARVETDQSGKVQLRLPRGSYTASIVTAGFRQAARPIVISEDQVRAQISQQVSVALQVQPPASGIEVYPANSLTLRAAPELAPVILSPADFAAIPHVTLTVHNAHSNADETYSGVTLATLLAKVNAPLGSALRGKEMTRYVVASGSDGYSVVFSLAEADPAFHAGQVLVADARDGKPLGSDGPFRLVVTDDKRPARWVHNLVSITLSNAQ